MSMFCLVLSFRTTESDTATLLNKTQHFNMKKKKKTFSPHILDFYSLTWVGERWILLPISWIFNFFDLGGGGCKV